MTPSFPDQLLRSPKDKGRSFLKCVNRLNVDTLCLGNHEADLQLKDLRARISELRGTLINSNVGGLERPSPSSSSVPFHSPTMDVYEVGKDHRVGFIGLLTDEPNVSS